MHPRAFPAALVLAMLCLPASADFHRWYAGVSAGQARTSHDLATNRETTVVNAISTSSDVDLNDYGWKVFGGWRFNDMLAFEVNYSDLGTHRIVTNIVGGDPPLPSAVETIHKISGYGADIVLSAPVGRRFSVFGRVGAFRSKLEAESSLAGSIVFINSPGERRLTATHNETVLRYGFGGEWSWRDNLALRLEWERHNKIGKAFEIGASGTTGEADTDFVSLGVLMRF